MTPEIRKIVTFDEEVFVEGFKAAEKPLRMLAVAAVIKNPWAGRFVEDLKPEIMAYGPILGEMMADRMIALAGSGDAIEAYGKAAVVGLDGEIEHASALIHTLRLVTQLKPMVKLLLLALTVKSSTRRRLFIRSVLAIFTARLLVRKVISLFPTHEGARMLRLQFL